MTIRKVKNSPQPQGEDERVAYWVDTAPWGGYGGSAAAVLKDASGTDISLTNMPGAASEAGGVITTPLVISLTRNIKYRLEILWVVGGNTFETYCEIIGEV